MIDLSGMTGDVQVCNQWYACGDLIFDPFLLSIVVVVPCCERDDDEASR
jgi:hypothetical protein